LLPDILVIIGVTLLPLAELRGGIPLGILHYGLNTGLVFILCTVANILLFFPIIWLLDLLYERLLSRWELFERYLTRTRRRGEPAIRKYGAWGLLLFVAVPLPTTGVYTGALMAWLLGVNRRQGLLAIIAGVLIAAILVTLASLSVIHIPLFIKNGV